MPNDKDSGTSNPQPPPNPTPNPAKDVQTPELPTKYYRDSADTIISNMPRGEKK